MHPGTNVRKRGATAWETIFSYYSAIVRRKIGRTISSKYSAKSGRTNTNTINLIYSAHRWRPNLRNLHTIAHVFHKFRNSAHRWRCSKNETLENRWKHNDTDTSFSLFYLKTNALIFFLCTSSLCVQLKPLVFQMRLPSAQRFI